MKLILEIRPHHRDEDPVYRIIETFPAALGRGFENDVIFSDPYISPQHLRIEHEGGAFFVTDTGSDNGLSINGAIFSRHNRAPLKTGDSLLIGQTAICVYTPAHPVATTLPLIKAHPFLSWLSRTTNVWACFLLALVFALGWTWLEIWTEEPGLALAGAGGGTVAVIVLWAALWSVAGRLARNKSNFRSHIATICLYMIAGTLGWYVETYVDFLTGENWVSDLVTYGVNFVILAFLLYGSLTLATLMTRKRRLVAAAFFSAGVVTSTLALSVISVKNFNQQPLYPATLEPYLSRLAPTESVDYFMKNNEAVFQALDVKD